MEFALFQENAWFENEKACRGIGWVNSELPGSPNFCEKKGRGKYFRPAAATGWDDEFFQ